MKQEKGVTLLEIIVVVLIISILTAVSIPNILEWLHQYRLQTAAASIVNHLRAARLLAIFKGVKHEVQIKPFGEGNYYQVVEDPGEKPEHTDQVVMSIGRVELNTRFGEVHIVKLTDDGRFSFKPKGTSTSGSITLENSKKAHITIVINGQGRIKIQS
jgi:prepilin-type N-terminal cleavage/methylation domain-containing protein